MNQKKLPETILSVDPGNIQSAYTIINTSTYLPIEFGKHDNSAIKSIVSNYIARASPPIIVIETMVSMGMRVGSEVFDTCIFLGRLSEFAESLGAEVHYVNRREEKLGICGTAKANDSSIRRALIDRLATFDKKNGKGTINNRDVLYGIAGDEWQALAAGCVWINQQIGVSWAPPKEKKKTQRRKKCED